MSKLKQLLLFIPHFRTVEIKSLEFNGLPSIKEIEAKIAAKDYRIKQVKLFVFWKFCYPYSTKYKDM